jgi:ABC-2 type transport system ATP-binding protein
MRGVAVVEIDGLTKDYPRRNLPALRALDGVSLRIAKGDIFALLGPNGAGKTTLIGCVAGLVRATSGSARVCGHDVVRGYREARRAVGLVPQEINFDPFLTVEESLRYQAGYFGVRLSTKRIDEILGALGLAEKRKDNTRMLSGGMKRRLLIAKALAHDPQVLFLDEPTAGVDVSLRRDLWAYVRGLRARGTTIVLTTHYLDEAEELADRIALIDHGKLLLEAEKQDLLRRFGQRTLRLTLSEPARELPPALAARAGALVDEGLVVEVTQPLGEDLGPVLAEVLAAGLHVRDVETRRTGLEEIYVKLVHGEAA